MNNGSFYKDSGGYANYKQKRGSNRRPDDHEGWIWFILTIIVLVVTFR